MTILLYSCESELNTSLTGNSSTSTNKKINFTREYFDTVGANTFTVPDDIIFIKSYIIPAGDNDAAASNNYGCETKYLAVQAGNDITITVGASGGGAGGDSSISYNDGTNNWSVIAKSYNTDSTYRDSDCNHYFTVFFSLYYYNTEAKGFSDVAPTDGIVVIEYARLN